jgi:hypothetical protein
MSLSLALHALHHLDFHQFCGQHRLPFASGSVLIHISTLALRVHLAPCVALV